MEATNTKIQERNNHKESCITVKVKNAKTCNYACKRYLWSFNCVWEKNLGVLIIAKGPHEPEFAYDIVRIHSLMIYSNLVEHNIVGDTKAALLQCFPFVSKLKGGDIITTGQYLNCQTFSNLQFRPLLIKNFFS